MTISQHTTRFDATRAEAALDELDRYRRKKNHGRSYPGATDHPITATVEEVRRLFGADRRSIDTGERLAALADPDAQDQREDILTRLRAIEDQRTGDLPNRQRARRDDEILDAVETLRELLTKPDGDDRPPMSPNWTGDRALELRRFSGDTAGTVNAAFADLGRRSSTAAHRTLYDAFEPRRDPGRIEANVGDLRRDSVKRDAVMAAIESLRDADLEDGDTLNALRVVIRGGSAEAVDV